MIQQLAINCQITRYQQRNTLLLIANFVQPTLDWFSLHHDKFLKLFVSKRNGPAFLQVRHQSVEILLALTFKHHLR